MSKKKIIILISSALALIILLIAAVPVMADSTVLTTPAQITPANKAAVLVRLLLLQDEAKVDSFIQKAVDAGKITPEQAVKVKDFWTANRAKAASYAKRVIIKRLLNAKDETKVQSFLDKAVAAGKITQSQADKVIQLWETLH
jgi:polyhydroxyalkanoate synthesis regulator phasin